MGINEKIRDIIKDNIGNTACIDGLSDDGPISSLEINSLTFMKIIVAIEDTFDFVFDYDMLDFSFFQSLNGLCEYVKTKIEKV